MLTKYSFQAYNRMIQMFFNSLWKYSWCISFTIRFGNSWALFIQTAEIQLNVHLPQRRETQWFLCMTNSVFTSYQCLFFFLAICLLCLLVIMNIFSFRISSTIYIYTNFNLPSLGKSIARWGERGIGWWQWCMWTQASFWLNCTAFILLYVLPAVKMRNVVSLYVCFFILF